MSLVYEALQKAEREKQRKTGSPPAPAPKPVVAEKPVTPVAAPAKSHQGVLVVVAASVALVAIVAIVLMVVRQTPAKTEEPVVRPVVPPVVKSQPVTPVQTPVPPVKETALKLTGIAPLPDGGFCAFFAGQPLPVYEEQPIEGATVKKIEKDRVTLEINGRKVVLRLF